MNATILEPSNKDLEALSYEEAFNELEEVVAALESGEQVLDQALALYERGRLLAKHCAKLLDQAELKVSLLADNQLVEYKDAT